jgi:hypothetical protein
MIKLDFFKSFFVASNLFEVDDQEMLFTLESVLVLLSNKIL